MRNDNSGLVSCGCWLVLFIVNLLLGSWSVNYLLLFFFEKTIPTFWAIVTGLFIGEFSIPVAIVVSILRYFGVV